MVVTHRLRRRRHGRQRRGSERRQQGLAHRKSPYLVMIGSGANPSGDQTRRGGGGSGVSGGPMISARSGRSPSGIGGRSGAAIVPARQLDRKSTRLNSSH